MAEVIKYGIQNLESRGGSFPPPPPLLSDTEMLHVVGNKIKVITCQELIHHLQEKYITVSSQHATRISHL